MQHTKNHASPRPDARLLTSIALVGALVVVLVIISSWLWLALPASPSHFVALPPGNQTASARRTVIVVQASEELPNHIATDKLLMTSLVDGQLPSQAMQAVVQTDANCQPDEHGVSHCLNELVVGTATIVVRHHHKMSDVPCLTPGETVTLLTPEQYQHRS